MSQDNVIFQFTYRRLAKQNHPDVGLVTERATRTRRMALINAAYEEAKGEGHA